MESPTIKTAKKFGHASHIIMGVNDEDKKFLVFPESSKYMLENVLKQYKISIETLTNPSIADVLSTNQIRIIKKLYKNKIKKTENEVHIKFLQNNMEEMENMSISEIGTILNDLENELPYRLKQRILKEYYRVNQTK